MLCCKVDCWFAKLIAQDGASVLLYNTWREPQFEIGQTYAFSQVQVMPCSFSLSLTDISTNNGARDALIWHRVFFHSLSATSIQFQPHSPSFTHSHSHIHQFYSLSPTRDCWTTLTFKLSTVINNQSQARLRVSIKISLRRPTHTIYLEKQSVIIARQVGARKYDCYEATPATR